MTLIPSKNFIYTCYVVNYACPVSKSDSSGWDLGQDGEFWNDKRRKLSHSSGAIDACTCTHMNVPTSSTYFDHKPSHHTVS